MVGGIVRQARDLLTKWVEDAVHDFCAGRVRHHASGADLVIMVILSPAAIAGSVLGDALAACEDVVGPSAGCGILFSDHVSGKENILGGSATCVLADAVSLNVIGVCGGCAVDSLDASLSVEGISVTVVIHQEIAGRIVTERLERGSAGGRLLDAIVEVVIHLKT